MPRDCDSGGGVMSKTFPETEICAVPLLQEYGSTVREGLAVGSYLEVPAGTAAAVVTPGDKLADLLPAGTHPVQQDILPGLAASVRMKSQAGARVPAAVYLLRLGPLR